jgi:hypothetical protein
VRHQALFFLLLSVFVVSGRAQQNDSAPVNCSQFIAWTARGNVQPAAQPART